MEWDGVEWSGVGGGGGGGPQADLVSALALLLNLRLSQGRA